MVCHLQFSSKNWQYIISIVIVTVDWIPYLSYPLCFEFLKFNDDSLLPYRTCILYCFLVKRESIRITTFTSLCSRYMYISSASLSLCWELGLTYTNPMLLVFFRFVLQQRPKILIFRGRPNWTASVERWAHLNSSVSSCSVIWSLLKLSYPIHNSPRFNENKVLIWIGIGILKWNVVESEWCSTYKFETIALFKPF